MSLLGNLTTHILLAPRRMVSLMLLLIVVVDSRRHVTNVHRSNRQLGYDILRVTIRSGAHQRVTTPGHCREQHSLR